MLSNSSHKSHSTKIEAEIANWHQAHKVVFVLFGKNSNVMPLVAAIDGKERSEKNYEVRDLMPIDSIFPV